MTAVADLHAGDGAVEPRTDQEINLHVGRVLKLARIEADLSQQAVADHLGITYQQVQKYEGGLNRVPISHAIRAAMFLGLTPDALFPRGGQPVPAGTVDSLQKSEVQLLQLMRRMPKPKREATARFLRAMAGEN